MPWDSNGGGGGRNNSGGPWGQAPGGGGPRRSGGGTPNLEEILNRGRDQFQGGMPRGPWLVIGIVVVVVGLWLSQCFYQVQQQEVGVELLFGQPEDQLSGPGLHFLFWPVEHVEKVAITENQTRVGSVRGSSRDEDEGLMLSGDQNVVDVAYSVLWRVTGPQKYLFEVRSPDEMVRKASESAMREVVGLRPAEDVFRDDRAGVQDDVLEITQNILSSYDAGISIAQISIENAAPPPDVADAFEEVQRAEQDQERFQEEARQYANTKLGAARGQAAQVRQEAAAYKNRVAQEAEGEAARFTSVYNEYIKAPEVTRQRIYLETLEDVYSKSKKVIVDEGTTGSGVVPYLPLDQLNRTGSSPAESPPPSDDDSSSDSTTGGQQ